MSYQLGVDLGTTFTAAARARGGRAEPVTLGSRSTAVPSVVYLSGDDLLVGEVAVRRAVTEPARVAREFKRRLGDPTPLLIGGSPVAAERLMARLLAWVVDQVATTEGEPPQSLAVTHPANWGEYKLDLLRQAIRHVDLTVDHLVPEPVAAASFYAAERDLAPGSLVAVYDLGGGTFDAATVAVDQQGFRIVGRPDGIERLGGIDFDHAVFGHVLDSLDLEPDQLDPGDAATTSALVRLRHDCVEAKEALSSETEVSIPVLLPNRHTEVRLTRQEFEAMVRPPLAETIDALRRAITSAQVPLDAVSAVLLVGGSSRIPLVAQMVTAELGRPVAVDARPKDAIALGAALLADRALHSTPVTHPAPAVPVPFAVPAASPPGPPPAASPSGSPTQPQPATTVLGQASGPPTQVPSDPGRSPAGVYSPVGGVPLAAAGGDLPTDGGGAPSRRTRRLWLVGGAVALVAVLLLATQLGQLGGDDPDDTTTTTEQAAATSTTGNGSSGETSTTVSSGSDGVDIPSPMPGNDWSAAARTQFVADCSTNEEITGAVAPLGGDVDLGEICGCMYDEISTSGLSFDEFNANWSSDQDIGPSSPTGQAMTDASLTCAMQGAG